MVTITEIVYQGVLQMFRLTSIRTRFLIEYLLLVLLISMTITIIIIIIIINIVIIVNIMIGSASPRLLLTSIHPSAYARGGPHASRSR